GRAACGGWGLDGSAGAAGNGFDVGGGGEGELGWRDVCKLGISRRCRLGQFGSLFDPRRTSAASVLATHDRPTPPSPDVVSASPPTALGGSSPSPARKWRE